MQVQLRRYSLEEYLELEEQADDKSEYHNGKITPMTGETTDHNEISGNLCVCLKLALRKQAYKIYVGSVRLWIPRYQQMTYPDVMVVQGRPEYYSNTKTTITNPQIIIEVLSKSTQNYDQGDKFTAYRSIPSFQEYILIDQTEYRVMQYVKTENGAWILTEIEGESAVLKLNSISVEVPFIDLYEGVDFDCSNDESTTT
jgi:Uma2 family endonuclease